MFFLLVLSNCPSTTMVYFVDKTVDISIKSRCLFGRNHTLLYDTNIYAVDAKRLNFLTLKHYHQPWCKTITKRRTSYLWRHTQYNFLPLARTKSLSRTNKQCCDIVRDVLWTFCASIQSYDRHFLVVDWGNIKNDGQISTIYIHATVSDKLTVNNAIDKSNYRQVLEERGWINPELLYSCQELPHRRT